MTGRGTGYPLRPRQHRRISRLEVKVGDIAGVMGAAGPDVQHLGVGRQAGEESRDELLCFPADMGEAGPQQLSGVHLLFTL